MEMDPEVQEITAFICPLGLFQFKVMLFGLKNAPATFQRLMEKAPGELKGVICFVDLDNIIVSFQSWEQHFCDVLKALQRFLSMAGWYHWSDPNFSQIAEPLSALKKKGATFLRSPACQAAFDALKKHLVNPPVLGHPNFNAPFFGLHQCQRDRARGITGLEIRPWN